MTLSTRKYDWVLLVISATLLSLSYPPLPLGFLAHFALVPLLFVLENKDGKNSFKLAFIWGLISALMLLHWISWVTFPGMLLACLILALYPAFVLWLFRSVYLKISKTFAFLVFPFLWIGMEFVRGYGELGFPWADLAHTQLKYTTMIQFADITGARGISFWVVLLNLLFFALIKNLNKIKAILLVVLIAILYIAPLVYGSYVMRRKFTPVGEFGVALLQGNIDPHLKWDREFQWKHFEEYLAMVKEVSNSASLVIWPETATANYLRRETDFAKRLQAIVDSIGVPNLVGSLDYEYKEGEPYYYNAAVLIFPGGEQKWYYKNHLVPFSEHFPFDQYSRFLRKMNRKIYLGQGDFTPGTEKVIMEINGVKFGTIICFESIFSTLAREFVRNGAQFLVVITNDGWFGKTAGPYQHQYIAVLRAIENRVPIARCANTGISCIIDQYGRISSSIPLNKKGYLVGSILLTKTNTFFTHYGDIISHISFATIPLTLFLLMFKAMV